VTAELAIVAAVRIAGSLLVIRWPLGGGILAVLVDLSDLLIIDVLDLGGVGDYQSVDKWLDQVYLAGFLVVALRWDGVERAVAVGLYAFRLVGFVAFELTGERGLLLAFPNVFELWFLLVAALHHFRPDHRWRPAELGVTLLVLTAAKEVQEWAIHGARVFDGIGALEALERAWSWLTGRR
jgi:hypothetical protein